MKQAFKIEKDIEIPMKRKRAKYPFKEMDIGDSFLIMVDPSEDKEILSIRIKKAQINVISAARNLEIKVVTRQEDGNLRCWRIEND